MQGIVVGVAVGVLMLPTDKSTCHALLSSSSSSVISHGGGPSCHNIPQIGSSYATSSFPRRQSLYFILGAVADKTITDTPSREQADDADNYGQSRNHNREGNNNKIYSWSNDNIDIEDPNSYMFPSNDHTCNQMGAVAVAIEQQEVVDYDEILFHAGTGPRNSYSNTNLYRHMEEEENKHEVVQVVDYDEILFHATGPNAIHYLSPKQIKQQFYGEDGETVGYDADNSDICTDITSLSEDSQQEENDFEGEQDPSETERSSSSSSENGDTSTNNKEEDQNNIRAAMAKSALLHRSGLAGNKSSRSTGRSSRAKTHVNKGRRGSSGSGAMGRVLGTVRTAAGAAAAQQEKKTLDENNTSEGDGRDLKATHHKSVEKNGASEKWKFTIQSTVANMLKKQDAAIQQQSVVHHHDVLQTQTSMGLLGEPVVHRQVTIPPLPGAFLVGTDKNDIRTTKLPMIVRASIPNSSDDTHIANLRLSVFSRFDEEQQRIFRSRSVEVLNVRRRRGAVVLVAEVSHEKESISGGKEVLMQARIMNGHEYGNVAVHTSSPSLTVRPGRGARVTSVSSGVAVDSSPPPPKLTNERGSIIGSIECSHQEFHGTMLGNARPKGSLMYITEVAVRTDTRRSGAGAMLMKGVDKVAALRNVETIYLHVDRENLAACSMYEKCGYHYLDKRESIYAQFTASLNLHDGAMHGRKHHLMCKNVKGKTTWLEDDDSVQMALGLLS